MQDVGPEHFGIVAVDCAKRRSKWMLCNFYGKVLVEPTAVGHTHGGPLTVMQHVADACLAEALTDCVVAVEMTGIYHKPVQRAFRKAKFDTRIVHPFASNHYRQPLHPDAKTDDHDLESIFQVAVKGYGLATLPVGEVYQSLQAVSRHRHNLVKQRARLMVQIRRLLHQAMPGFADLWEDDKLFSKSVAMPVALKFSSAAAIQRAGVGGMERHLRKTKVRFQTRTIERIVAWAGTAFEPSELADMHTRQGQQLDEVRQLFGQQIDAAERQLRDDALARKTCRTSKTPAGAKRRSVISSMLHSNGKHAGCLTLESVVAEATRWLNEGASCFARQVETCGLGPPGGAGTAAGKSLLDRVVIAADA